MLKIDVDNIHPILYRKYIAYMIHLFYIQDYPKL